MARARRSDFGMIVLPVLPSFGVGNALLTYAHAASSQFTQHNGNNFAQTLVRDKFGRGCRLGGICPTTKLCH